MNQKTRITLLVLTLLLAFGSVAFAAAPDTSGINAIVEPNMVVTGTTVKCTGQVKQIGASIDATLELWQGSTLIESWNKTGSTIVAFSETETIVHGLTYTLTLSGTINGVPFTPRSITRTL